MHDFNERLHFSEGVEMTRGILKHIYQNVPAAVEVIRAEKEDDLNGTDYWVIRDHALPPISIDMKNREFCPIERFQTDDACIETCSQFISGERRKIGWTLDERKRTDLIVYTWPNPKGLRFWILYFPMLCQASRLNWQDWKKQYGERAAENKNYQTLSIYPPRRIIAESMRDLTVGIR